MCGIYLSVRADECQIISSTHSEALSRRGPDNAETTSRQDHFKSDLATSSLTETQEWTAHLTFVSTVLSLRGSSVVKQPLIDASSDSLLCWNGEAWSIDGQPVQGNDTEAVFQLLLGIPQSRESLSAEERLQSFLRLISRISGPFAFIFYDAPHHRVFFGRDVLVGCLI